jgi:hypothetical protein
MAMVAALAPAGLAGKGGQPGPPSDGGGGGGPFSVSVELFDAHEPRLPYMWEPSTLEEYPDPGFPFHWVSQEGDVIVVRLIVEPSDSASSTTISVCDSHEIFAACSSALIETIDGPAGVVDSAPYSVTDLFGTVDKRGNFSGSFTFTVTIEEVGGETLSVTTEVPWTPDDDCVRNPDGSYTIDGVCIWTPSQLGMWDIRIVEAYGRTGNSRRLPSLTVRDHVPGNWCLVPDGGYFAPQQEEWGFLDGWSPDGTTRTVYLPTGEVPGEHPGVCLKEGAGGRNTMGVGDSRSFYVATNAKVTFTPATTEP